MPAHCEQAFYKLSSHPSTHHIHIVLYKCSRTWHKVCTLSVVKVVFIKIMSAFIKYSAYDMLNDTKRSMA